MTWLDSFSSLQDPNKPWLERSLSTFDIPHVLQFSDTYDLPFGPCSCSIKAPVSLATSGLFGCCHWPWLSREGEKVKAVFLPSPKKTKEPT